MIDKYIALTSNVKIPDLNNMIDNHPETSIETDFNDEIRITIELPSLTKTSAYSITFTGEDVSKAPRSWLLQGSTNGGIWNDITKQQNISFTPQETKVFNEYMTSYSAAKAYRFYRIIFTENNGNEKLSIAEFQLHGSEQQFENSITNNGGTLSVQYDNTNSGEAPYNLIDKKADTKYVANISGNGLWIVYNSPTKTHITSYSLTSANNAPERDPVDWTLYGSNDENNWTALDSRTDQLFGSRYTTMGYQVETEETYQYFKLDITKIKSGKTFQLAEWQLSGTENGTNAKTPEKKQVWNIYCKQYRRNSIRFSPYSLL